VNSCGEQTASIQVLLWNSVGLCSVPLELTFLSLGGKDVPSLIITPHQYGYDKIKLHE